MKKTIMLIFCLLIAGCANQYPSKPIRAMSNEAGTKIYLNDEYVGTDATTLYILNSRSSDSYVSGIKKGCEVKKLQIEYQFDYGVFNIADIRNIGRLFTGNVFVVNEEKDLYNVSPMCD